MTYTVVFATSAGRIYATLNHIPIDLVFELAKQRLEEGRLVAIYPETEENEDRP